MINHIPIRLDYYQSCAETWREILKNLPLAKIDTIIDLCCGWSPKLELALLQTDFKGTLYAFDKSEENLRTFRLLIDPFPKNFTVTTKVFNLFKPQTENFLKKADLILANHIIDDLLIDYYQMKYRIKNKNIFGDKTQLIVTWNKILEDKNLTNDIIPSIVNFFHSHLNKNGYLIISQYLGYQEKLYGMEKLALLSKNISKKLQEILGNINGFSNDRNILDRVFAKIQNPYFQKQDIICLRKLSY